jgi:3-oxoacyl-[acyl-carrier-protein] synthase-3
MYYQGHDLWSPAHYLAGRLGARQALPFGVQQVCNGGVAGLELTAARLAAARAAEPDRVHTGLVTTADRFTAPGFDRWSADYGVVYGDGATAALLRTPSGPEDAFLLRSVVTVAAPELEAMHRGADAFTPAARTRRERVDMRATKRAYLAEHGNEPFLAANRRAVTTIVETALAEAGLTPDDPRLTCAVLPRFGRKTLDQLWRPQLATLLRTEFVDFGRTTGHLGAGDALAGLAELAAQRLLEPGEAALVFSAGAGFTWSCLVVEAPA